MQTQIRFRQQTCRTLPLTRSVGTHSLTSYLIHAACLISRYRELAKQRAELRQLSDDQLIDIGLTREMAEKEANKPFWVE